MTDEWVATSPTRGGGPLGGTRKASSNSLPNIKLTKHLPLSSALGFCVGDKEGYVGTSSSFLKDMDCLLIENILSGAFRTQKGLLFRRICRTRELCSFLEVILTELEASRTSVCGPKRHICTHPGPPDTLIQNEVSESHDQTESSFSLAAPRMAKDSTGKNTHSLSSSYSPARKCITETQEIVGFGILSVFNHVSMRVSLHAEEQVCSGASMVKRE